MSRQTNDIGKKRPKTFVEQRIDGSSLIIIRDLIESGNRNNIPGLILYLDQTKAYDRYERDFFF